MNEETEAALMRAGHQIATLQADVERLRAEVAAWRWGYRYLQDRMRSLDRHGWAEDCDGEIEARIKSVSRP